MWRELKPLHGVLLWMMLFCTTLASGQVDSCQERLTRASQLYEQGKLSQVIQTLGSCLFDRDQNRVTRRTALNLAAEAYIFMDSTRLAQNALLELLQIDPFYKINAEIPEMLYLRRQVINYPALEIAGFFGPYLFSKPGFQSSEALPGATITSRKYSFKGADGEFDIDWGYHAGAEIGLALHRHSNFDIHFGLNVSRYSFRYLMELENIKNFDGQLTKGQVFAAEKHLWLRVPLYLSLNLVPREEIVNRQFIPYVKFGGSFDRLNRESAKFTALRLSFPADSTIFSIGQKNGAYRKSGTISALVGAGFKLHFHRLFVLLDAQFTQTLQNLRNTKENRLTIPEYRYVDNDFTLSNGSIRLGLGMFLFQAKVR